MILFYIPWNGSKCRSWFHQKTWKGFCIETSYYAGNMNQLLLPVLIHKNQFLWIIFPMLEGAIFCVLCLSLDPLIVSSASYHSYWYTFRWYRLRCGAPCSCTRGIYLSSLSPPPKMSYRGKFDIFTSSFGFLQLY